MRWWGEVWDIWEGEEEMGKEKAICIVRKEKSNFVYTIFFFLP